VDPKEQIFAETSQYIESFHLLKADLLVVTYDRSNQEGDIKRESGLILPKASALSNTLGEDQYQGKVGLVMKLGPLAFTEADGHKWVARTPRIAAWVMFHVGDGFPFHIPGKVKEWKARVLEDVHIKLIIDVMAVVY